jgi:putative intracellular protease/amidase
VRTRSSSYDTLQDDIRCAGGAWEDREVVVDGTWVTSRQPQDIPAFGREMIAVFVRVRVDGAQGGERPAARGVRGAD